MLNRRRVLLGGTALAAAAVVSSVPFVARAQPSQWDKDVVAWLKANALPLATAEPGSGFSDLELFRAIIGNARVVSMGEATHGTREFFQLKHRMIEYCVSQLGFTVIGFEAEYGATLSVNDYVLHGKGKAKDVVVGMGFWTWDTEEVVALIEWVRAWNLTHERKVKFYGFDMQSGAASALHVLGYLERVAPNLATESERILSRLCSRYAGQFDLISAAERETISAQIKTVHDAFAAERELWAGKTGELDWQLGRRSAIVLEQFLRLEEIDGDGRDFEGGFKFRDRCMADNVHALLEAEGPDAKVLLWAHNGHVQKSAYFDIPNMGSFLAAELGVDYRVVGFAFNQGSFQAKDSTGRLRDHAVEPAPEYFVDAALAATGIPLFAIDLMHVPADGPVASWMASKPAQRTIGSGFDLALELLAALEADPRDNFDVLVFVETTTAARGNKWPPRVAAFQPTSVKQSNEKPTNLAFADGTGTPRGWHVTDASLPPYVVALEDGVSPDSGRAVRIARASSSLPWGDGALTQIFPAAPWRGRRLVFSAAIRADAPTIGTGAMLLVHVHPKQQQGSDAKAAKTILAMQADGLVRSSGWVRGSVAVDVPLDAERLQISLAVTGSVSVWFGDLIIGTAPSEVAGLRMPPAIARRGATGAVPPRRLGARADLAVDRT
jgi:erythromycin esterase